MASDAFVVGEDWISEHYFNTESTKQSFHARLLNLRKEWDARAKEGEATPASRLVEVRRDVQTALARENTGLESYNDDVLTPLVRALGYGDARWHETPVGPVTLIAAAEAPDAVLAAVVRARRVEDVSNLLAKDESTLIEPFTPEGGDEVRSVARTLSYLFSGEDAPAFAIVVGGTWALLAERDRWPEGRYLAVDLQLVLDRNDQKKRAGEFDRAVAILSSETVLPDVDGTTWWAETLDDSVKHTVGVSKDLREGVRESIEIVANEVVRRRIAHGLAPLPDDHAQVLARQSLRYLYRILFLLYAEASPELKVLPVNVPEYALGYGLDRLRELVLVELVAESRDRTHLYASLEMLTRLVDAGHNDLEEHGADETLQEGLTFNSLNADLFSCEATRLIDEVKLGDDALQRVLELLLLTRENPTKKGRDRGFISYADLGINQLGAVYEGLMSYTGFFAAEDLYEVAPAGDGSKGSWVVPVTRADGIAPTDFIHVADQITGEQKPRRYSDGEFVFRLSGRERQTSASYYSPEVLTKFVVSQALEELLDQDGQTTTAEDILSLSVCEPALGSGAFAIEAVRQLAEQYLDRRERETGERIDPDERPSELQRAKAAIALHQVYGVDLNATAVELAEISLWLDTMVDGLQAPWFGLRLRRGNSLIGARRALYSEKQVSSKSWLKDVPTEVAVSTLVDDMREGRTASATSGKIHHFLLPAEGWGSAVDAKEGKELAPEAVARLREWRKRMRQKPSKDQIKKLQGLAHRVEVLWQFTLRRLEIAETQVRREVTLWNDPRPPRDGGVAVTRAEIEAFLKDPDGAYQRLRRVMDAWCAMWFWPLTGSLTDGAQPPILDEWIAGLTALLGQHAEVRTTGKATEGAQMLGVSTTWHDLGVAEDVELGYAFVEKIDDAIAAYPWLRAAENIATANGFFHWELDFAGVFARGGFDLQVGNPPWVRPRSDVDALLAEGDPWWQLKVKPTQTQLREKREQTLQLEGVRELVIDGTVDVACTAAFVGAPTIYPYVAGLQPDLYRCFMELSWRNNSAPGVVALIHYETHMNDEKGGFFRGQVYPRLRRRWDFINELKLFDIQHQKRFGVNVYGRSKEDVNFMSASSLYHPDTVHRSLTHDGTGPLPGLKDEMGRWDLRPHAGRITNVTDTTLRDWNSVLGDEGNDYRHTKMIFSVNGAFSRLLSGLACHPRVRDKHPLYSRGWDESVDRKKGRFEVQWGAPESWNDVIFQGPHLFVNNPFYKSPNATLKHQQDWSEVDLGQLGEDDIPVTGYKPAGDLAVYNHDYTQWECGAARDYYRVAWRRMAANTGERTLVPALVPPGSALIQTVASFGIPQNVIGMTVALGFMSSLIADAMIRAAPKSDILFSTVGLIPCDVPDELLDELVGRVARLNAGTSAYAEFWNEAGRALRQRALLSSAGSGLSAEWSPEVFARGDTERRLLQIEVDVLVSISLGISVEQLCDLYRTQFPVLFGYDRNSYLYDANGRLVPQEVLKVWRKKSDAIAQEERTALHPGSGVAYEYELPFVTLDREADMRQAYAHFEKILEERS